MIYIVAGYARASNRLPKTRVNVLLRKERVSPCI